MKNVFAYIDKIKWFLIIIIALSIAIFFGIKNEEQTQNTIIEREDKRDFAIQDTSSISKIIMQNKNLDTIILTKFKALEKHYWELNGDTILANQYSINLLLKTVKEMRIKQPIARSALENVILRMATQNTKVDFFSRNKKIKTIYIGGETADQLGTFMMLEGAKEPYIVHIPGFIGYLSSRFSCKEKNWRSKQIFNSYNLNGLGIQEANYIFTESVANQPISFKKETTLTSLENIFCEQFITDNKRLQNELKNREPFMIIEVGHGEGKWKSTLKLNCVRKKTVDKIKYQNQKYDQERFYGIIGNSIMLIQYKQLQHILASENLIREFMPWIEENETIN